MAAKKSLFVMFIMMVGLNVSSSVASDFPGFTYSQLLEHFRYYHERSECIYLGNGAWAALETNLSHPLERDSSRRAQGYMRAFTVSGEQIYRDRARAALEWLLADQKPDGHFTWWNTPSGTDNTFDCQYTTGEGGSALAEGYAFFGDTRYLQGSAKAAEWEENLELVWNTNYVLFTVWHLAKHYRITGERRWLDAAVYKTVNCAFPRQDTDGGWKEGPGAPQEMIGHNKRIWYHAIILRGLIELYRVLPADHPIRPQLRNSIQASVNRALDMQMPSGEIAVGAGVPNEHRNAFILEALLMAHEYVGIDTSNAVRGIMQYRMDFSKPPYQVAGFNIDIQAIGYLMQRYNAVVPNPPPEPPSPPIPSTPEITNPDFEADGGFFTLAYSWQTYGYGKREGFQETGHGWVQGLADYPEGKCMGIYQFVGGVQPGAAYRVSAEVRCTSPQLAGSIGAAGFKTHNCQNAGFSNERSSTTWGTLSFEVTAIEPWITIFLRGRNTDPYRISFERVLFDNVRLTRLDPAPPLISLSLSSLTPTAVVGSSPPPDTFTVRNGGSGSLSYTITDDSEWLSVTPSSGVSSGEIDTITVNHSTSGLGPGIYTGVISVFAEGASNSPQRIQVTLTITQGGSSQNLLANPDFEGGFRNVPDIDHRVANSWTHWVSGGSPKFAGLYGICRSPNWSQSFYESSWTMGIYQCCTVTLGRQYSAHAWVAGFSNSSGNSGSTDVRFQIGIDPTGGTNPSSANVRWSSEISPGGTWTRIEKATTAQASKITVFIKARNVAPTNRYATIDDAGLFDEGPTLSVGQAKVFPNNTNVNIFGAIVSAARTDFCYVEDPDRAAGIRVEKSGHNLSNGDTVAISGTIRTSFQGEKYIEATEALRFGSGILRPLAIANHSIGGGDYLYNPTTGTGQRGVTNGRGPNNIGLLISTWGRITYYDNNTFYLDDGSGLKDGSSIKGVRVSFEWLLPSVPAVSIGQMALVSGIVRPMLVYSQAVEQTVPVIYPRSLGDIITLQ